jgi:hypothetical protein
MKIYDHNLTGTSTGATSRTSETYGSDRAANSSLYTPRGDGDRVELSDGLRELSRALTAFGRERISNVRALTDEYQSGRYVPDAIATGRALVADALAPADR